MSERSPIFAFESPPVQPDNRRLTATTGTAKNAKAERNTSTNPSDTCTLAAPRAPRIGGRQRGVNLFRRVCPKEQLRGERIFDLLLDGPLERPRTEHRVEADLRDLVECGGRDVELDVHAPELRFETPELDPRDRMDVLFRQRVEDHDLVDPIDEL